MASWPDIDPQILRLLIDGGEELVRVLWGAISGGDSASDAAKKAIEAARRKGQEAFAKAVQDELEQQAAVANLAIQIAKLGPMTEHVLLAFDQVDSVMPKLNEILDIEEIKPE